MHRAQLITKHVRSVIGTAVQQEVFEKLTLKTVRNQVEAELKTSFSDDDRLLVKVVIDGIVATIDKVCPPGGDSP
jgi:hypothetical protein